MNSDSDKPFSKAPLSNDTFPDHPWLCTADAQDDVAKEEDEKRICSEEDAYNPVNLT